MRKKISICFIIAAMAVIASILPFLVEQEKRMETAERGEQETQAPEAAAEAESAETEALLESMSVTLPEGAYLIKECDGFLVVYHRDGDTVYDVTNIRLERLPEEIKLLVKEGLVLQGEKELYDFLESYSS